MQLIRNLSPENSVLCLEYGRAVKNLKEHNEKDLKNLMIKISVRHCNSCYSVENSHLTPPDNLWGY